MDTYLEPGRETAREFFRRSIRHGRLAHAYILIGPEGSRKIDFALELAKTLMCASGCKPGAVSCAVCRQVESGNHPDVRIIAPASAGGRVVIDDTREMRRLAYLARFQGPCKVFIVSQADRMTEAAQNQVLKVLEEPPENTVILLLAGSLAGLVETVISRCAVVRLGGLSRESVQSELARQDEFPAEQVAWAARLSRGSISRAERLLRADAAEFNNLVAGAIISDAPDADMALADLLKGFSSAGRDNRQRRVLTIEAFDLLATLLRDALIIQLDIASENLYNAVVSDEKRDAAARSDNVGRLSLLFAPDDILDLLPAIADMQRRVDQNLNIELLCDCLSQRVFEHRMKAAP